MLFNYYLMLFKCETQAPTTFSICPKCGHIVEPGSKYCDKCGSALAPT
ncbi:MAG: zinc-ribbon domain-containing protein [Candidatus Helarchaeota archaeon]